MVFLRSKFRGKTATTSASHDNGERRIILKNQDNYIIKAKYFFKQKTNFVRTKSKLSGEKTESRSKTVEPTGYPGYHGYLGYPLCFCIQGQQINNIYIINLLYISTPKNKNTWGNRGNRGNRVTLPQIPSHEENFFSSRGSKPQPSVTAVTSVTSRVLFLPNLREFGLPLACRYKIRDNGAPHRGQLLLKQEKSSTFAA